MAGLGFNLLLFLLLFGIITPTASEISNLRKCGDRACSVTLSKATALARYPASSPLHLSLTRGDVVEIKSKSAGSRPDLWGGEVNGRKGYFPKAFVKEFQVKIENPTFEVPTEENVWSKQPAPPQQQQQQEDSVKLPSEETPQPVADDVTEDETEIDETDLTDMDELDEDQTTQEESAEQDSPEAEKPRTDDDETGEKKKDDKDDSQALFRDPLLQGIEDLQRSLMREEVPKDPQVFNDFLAKQFGSESAAAASAPASPPAEDDETELDEDSENSVPDTESDQTEKDHPIPAEGNDRSEMANAEVKQEEETKESDSPYINGVTVMENDDDEEEEVHQDKVPQADDVHMGKTSEETADETEVKEDETEVKATEDKAEETEKIDELLGKTLEEMADETEVKVDETEVKATEDKAEETEKIDEHSRKTSEETADETEVEAAEEKVEETVKTEDKEAKEPQTAGRAAGEDVTEVEAGEPSKADEKDRTGEDVDKAEAKTSQPSGDSANPLEASSETPHPPQDDLVETGSKLSEQNVVHQVIEEKEAAADMDQPGARDKPKVDPLTGKGPDGSVDDELTGKVPGDSASDSQAVKEESVNIPAGGSEHAATTVSEGDAGEQKGSEQPIQSGQVKGKGTEEKVGVEKEGTPAVARSGTSDSVSLPSDETGKGVTKESSTDSQQNLDDEGREETEKPQIQPDKTKPEPPAHSVSGHQPVDIDFVAEVAKDSSVALEGSQSAAEEPLPTRTPALQDSPSLQAEQSMRQTATDTEPEASQPAGEDESKTTLIDGTRFYLVNGEIADIVPESVPADGASEPVPAEMDTSSSPAQATQEADIQPTATTHLPDVSSLKDVPAPLSKQQVQNDTREMSTDSQTDQTQNLNIDAEISAKQYQTNADILSRKVLSVNTQIPDKPNIPEEVPPMEQDVKQTQEQQRDTQSVETASTSTEHPAAKEDPAQTDPSDHVRTNSIQPSVTVEKTAASVVIEGEEPDSSPEDQSENVRKDPAVDSDAAPHNSQERDESSSSSAPPVEENWVTKLSSDADTEQEESGEAQTPPGQVVDGGRSEGMAGSPEASGTPKVETSTPPDDLTWDSVPPPPAEDTTTPGEQQGVDEPTVEGDPYQMDDFYGRKISDEELTKAEEEAEAYPSGPKVGTLEAQSRAFIEKLPPSIQSLLEQEPLGLSPGMTVLVTVTTFVMFLSLTCFSCLCSSGNKKTGTKDPLVVVRELEEKLLMAVKEKENLEDLLQERQTENIRLKTDMSDLQSKSGTMTTDLQNVKLHNEVLKGQVSTLQTDLSGLQSQLSKKSDDVKTKDKKAKDVEKETKKLQDAKQKLEQSLQKKESEQQRLEVENENLKSTIQSLTDQVQLLDTSKQQLLSEAEDWKEKVEELKERMDQMEQANQQAQDTITFKNNELEVMKDCYLQLKAFEKGGADEEHEHEEDDDTQEHGKYVQEKIQAMMDVSKVNATLRAVQEEKDNLDNRLKIENDARKELEEQLECVRREMESSMADKMKAERQCQEAQTKLTVLSSYFKDKELQLQRELGEQEALKKQNLSRLDSADENTRTLQKELEMSRQQVESLKRELAASERDFRGQIAANEKKAHENWLNARAAERELKETRHEAAVLRQKLTDLERRQMDLIRPLPTRAMPPPGMLNGPPPPGMERSPSRGSLPPGAMPPGPPPPPFREGEFPLSPRERERLPPSHPARHMPPPDARSPPPRMLPPEARGSPPRMLPPEARSPPPYDRRGPPHPMDSRSPPMRLPPPDMVPPLRGPLPPRMAHPPMGSPGPRMDSPRDSRQGPHYGRPPPPPGDSRRHQSQV